MASAPPSDEYPVATPVPLRPVGDDRAHLRLPEPLTRLIDRAAELTLVIALLRRAGARLVTLTGPGGVGKTRLALEIIHRLRDELDGRVAFVSLAAMRDPDRLVADLALALDVRAGPGDAPFDAVVAGFGSEPFVLVLDNFEHLLSAASVVTDLLGACPALRVLVTSRARLHLSGEQDIPVLPLPVPAAPAWLVPRGMLPPGQTVEDIGATAAIRLFVDRATAVNPTFALTSTNAGAVAEICRRLDGLPLAMELAAVRTRVLSPAALLARLEQRLHVLTGGPVDQPERLRTLRAAIAWSDELLGEAEQTLFRRLAVFVGGFTLEGAEALHPDPGSVPGEAPGSASPSATTTLDLMTSLIDHSLLRRVGEVAGEPRFAMLETIREYAREQLHQSGEEQAVHDAHAAWMVTLVERADAEIAGPNQQTWVERVEAEWGNLRAALDWLMASGDTGGALHLGGTINWFWSSAGHFEEGRERMAELAALPGAEAFPGSLAKVLYNAADIADWQGDPELARASYERALPLSRALGDRPGIAIGLRGLASAALDQRDHDRAAELLTENLALAHEDGNMWAVAAATNMLGSVAYARGDYVEAVRCYEEAHARWTAIGGLSHTARALVSVGWAALVGGDLNRAMPAYRTVIGLIEGIEESDGLTGECLQGCAGLALRQGETTCAVHLFTAAETEWHRIDIRPRPAVQASIEQMLGTARATLGEAAFDVARNTGRARTVTDALAEGRLVLAETMGSSADDAPERVAPYGLTRREREVLRLLTLGQSDREIAAALFISRPTASKHVSNILDKLSASSRAAATAIAVRDGLV